jgi:hypothetical protein
MRAEATWKNSESFEENLIGRSEGPMTFRLILQPAMAVFLAIRAGLRDAREGKPPLSLTALLIPPALAAD